MNRFYFLLIIFLLFCSSYLSYSQCGCTGGAASGGLSPSIGSAYSGVLGKESYYAGIFYRFTNSTDYYLDDNKAGRGEINDLMIHNATLFAAYGLTKALSIDAELSINPLKHQEMAGDSVISTSGLSHLNLNARYRLLRHISLELDLTVGGGIRLPLSSCDKSVPVYMQPGQGAFAYSFMALLHKGFKNENLHFYLISKADFMMKNCRDYYYGDYIMVSINAYKNLGDLRIGAEIRYDNNSKDTYDNIKLLDTGNELISFTPLIGVSFGRFTANAFFELPLYKRYNGFQLGTAYSAGLSFIYAGF